MRKFNAISRALRRWGASGVIWRPPDTKLNSDSRDQIKLFLGSREVQPENLEEFFQALEAGITNFKSYELIRERSRPAVVRENLNRARRLAERLYESLQGLDGNSHQLILEAHAGGSGSLQAAAANTITALDAAIGLANEYPQAGRLPEPHRVYLAADVADALRTYLDVEPTTTKDGLFAAILDAVLSVATGRDTEQIHELVRTTLSYNVKLKHADGIIEYVPPRS